MEPIEHEVQLVVWDPRPAIGDCDDPVADADVDGATRGVELAGVVEQTRDGALDGRVLSHDWRRHGAHHDRAPRSALVARRQIGNQFGQIEWGRDLIGRVTARHRHDLVDEVRELVGLGAQVGHDGVAIGIWEIGEATQRVEIGAQARERCAQFVTGVLHEAVLLVLRPRQGRQHAIERRSEPAHLIRATVVDRHVETPGGLDVLGGNGEPAQRCSDAAGDPQAGCDRRRGNEGHVQQQARTKALQHTIGLVERTTDLDGTTRVADRSHPELAGSRRDGLEQTGTGAPDQCQVTLGHRKRFGERGLAHRTVAPHGLRIQPRKRTTLGQSLIGAERPFDRRVDRDQRAIDLGEQPIAGGAVAHCPQRNGGQRRDRCHRQGDLPTQAHGRSARATYPTPRTVWIKRGSSCSSVLRRR